MLGLGPAQNTFGDATTADRAAAEALRDAYANAQAAWLALYNGNRSFWIRLVWAAGTVEQRRNAAGDAWEDVTNVIRGPAGLPGAEGHLGLLCWFAPGNAEALPAGEVNRSPLTILANSARHLRYRTAQAAPNEVLTGQDPGIRALTAAQAAEADLLTGEALPDYAVFEVPMGVVCRAVLHAQHDAASDVSLQAFIYEVLASTDDVRRTPPYPYAAGIAEPLGIISSTQTPRMGGSPGITINAKAAARRFTWIASGFQGGPDANGHWYWEFEILEAP